MNEVKEGVERPRRLPRTRWSTGCLVWSGSETLRHPKDRLNRSGGRSVPHNLEALSPGQDTVGAFPDYCTTIESQYTSTEMEYQYINSAVLQQPITVQQYPSHDSLQPMGAGHCPSHDCQGPMSKESQEGLVHIYEEVSDFAVESQSPGSGHSKSRVIALLSGLLCLALSALLGVLLYFL